MRGPLVENTHHVAVAVVSADGKLIARCGDPQQVMVLRSTAKPFQAQALFHTDAVTRYHVSQHELALACASHDSTPEHVDRVRAWLARLGLTDEDLGCGPHLPGHEASRHRLIRTQPKGPRPIHNNCSGKHAGMLTACLTAGWSLATYLAADHPLQQIIRATIEDLSGFVPLLGAVDGCSAPTFGLPVTGLARMYGRLADPLRAPEAYRRGLAAAYEAMREHPELVAGPTTLDTLLMRTYPDIIAKRGADGGYGMAIRQHPLGPLGVGVWVSDGSTAARDCAVLEVLRFLEISADSGGPLDRNETVIRRNCRNVDVGRLEARLELQWCL